MGRERGDEERRSRRRKAEREKKEEGRKEEKEEGTIGKCQFEFVEKTKLNFGRVQWGIRNFGGRTS